MQEQVKWTRQYLAPLVGATITKVELAVEEDEKYGIVDFRPRLTILTKDGETYEIEVFQNGDEERGGYLSGLPQPDSTAMSEEIEEALFGTMAAHQAKREAVSS